MNEQLIEQALHGYRSGHRLLTSSVELPPADRRLLAVVTDSPDVGKNRQWSPLFAGYPLPSAEWFALSMTWAAEQDRPGAVVTHTLLLDEAAVAIADRLDILRLFARPNSTEDIRGYSKPLAATVDARPRITGLEEWAAEITWVLHEPPLRPVEVVTSEVQARRHELLLRVWLEIWPELRATWTFAEAPATRKTGFRKQLDLQVMHRPNGIAPADTRVVASALSRKPPAWATSMATLDRGQTWSLHDFLDRYGPEANGGRQAISSLTDIWMTFESASMAAGVDRVALMFPQPDDVVSLKTDLLGSQRLVGVARAPQTADMIVAALASQAKAFDAADTADAARQAVEGTDQKALITIGHAALTVRSRSILSTTVIDAVAERVKTDRGRASRDLLVPLARLRPEIATATSAWQLAEAGELWDAVRSARGQKLRRAIVTALISSDIQGLQGAVAEAWPTAYEVALDAIAQGTIDGDPASEWLAAAPPEQARRWLVRLASVDLDRAHELISSLDPQLIVALKPDQLRALAARSDAAPAALVVAFFAALEDESAAAAETAVSCYQRLYELAVVEALGDARRPLDEADIDVPFWDAAQRLARLLSSAFKKQPWPLAPIMTLDQDPFLALISADAKAALARRIISSSEVQLVPSQEEALAEVIASRADHDGLRDALISLFSRVKPF